MYKYQPLHNAEHIRLLKILGPPALHHHDSVRLELLACSLAEAPPYECVMYAWQSTQRDRSIPISEATLDKADNQRPYAAVTESLLQAIPFLLSASSTGFLWIDQLCINQDDFDERSAQVAIMGQIFSKAKRLLIWLGPENEDTLLVKELLNVIEQSKVLTEPTPAGNSNDPAEGL